MATVKNLSITSLGATLVALGLGGAAQAYTLRFDELPYQPVDDLSFQGVTFDFKVNGVDSPGAYYNSPYTGENGSVQYPSLKGYGPGTLTLKFAAPTRILSFGVGQFYPKAPVTVELFDPTLTSLGVTTVALKQDYPSDRFFDTQFTYNGTLVSQAVVNFPESNYVPYYQGFAIDNLTYEPVPEPITIVGSGMALGFGVLMERQYSRKRKKAKQTGA